MLTHNKMKEQKEIPIIVKEDNPKRKSMTKAEAVADNKRIKEANRKVNAYRDQLMSEEQEGRDGPTEEELKAQADAEAEKAEQEAKEAEEKAAAEAEKKKEAEEAEAKAAEEKAEAGKKAAEEAAKQEPNTGLKQGKKAAKK